MNSISGYLNVIIFQPKKRLSLDETPVTADTEMKQTILERSQTEAVFNKDKAIPVAENSGISPHSFTGTTVIEDEHDTGGVGSIAETSLSGNILNDEMKLDAGHTEEADTRLALESNTNGEMTHENASDAQEGTASPPARDLEVVRANPPTDSSQNTVLGNTKSPLNIENEVSQILSADPLMKADNQLKDADLKAESGPDRQRHPERSTVISAEKVQGQLDEVKYLYRQRYQPIYLPFGPWTF